MIDKQDPTLPNQQGPVLPNNGTSPGSAMEENLNHEIENLNTTTDSPETKNEEAQNKEPINQEINFEELHNEPVQETKTQNEKNSANQDIYEKTKWALINLGPVATALVHGYAGLTDLWFFKNFEDSKIRKFVDNLALNFSKIILTASCGFNGYEAIKKNRLWEALSRFIEPLFIIAERRTEDLGLARGIGLGISQLVGAQEGIYNEVVKQRYGIDLTDKDETHKPTMGQDHDVNWIASKKITAELFGGGLGNNRRFLTGLGPANIKDKLGKFVKQFNLGSIKEFFSSEGNLAERYERFCQKSGISHIQELCMGDEKKDKGHTTFLSGATMIIGSLLGYLGKENKTWAYKLGGTIRNLGGVLADISIFGHKDPYFNASAIFLSVNTFMDIVQRFIPPAMKQIILPWSNISMATYNIGCGLYLNRSNMKTNNQDIVQTYDTDLAKKESSPRTAAENLAMAA